MDDKEIANELEIKEYQKKIRDLQNKLDDSYHERDQ
jgi:hypothetical protein